MTHPMQMPARVDQQGQIVLPFPVGSKVLEIGGGDIPVFRPNMDMRKLPTVDIVANLEERWPIEDGTYDGVFGKFVIEHMSWRKTLFFARECARVLKKTGIAVMIGPNTLEQCKEIARRNKISIDESAMLFGGQEEPGWNEHKAAFSPEYIDEIWGKAGFEEIDWSPLPGCNTDLIFYAYRSKEVWKAAQQGQTVVQAGSQWLVDLEASMTGGKGALPTIISKPEIVENKQSVNGDYSHVDKFLDLRLNIGSFIVMYKNWLNIDILDMSQYAQQNGYSFRQVDVTKGLPFGDDTVKDIVCSHMLEHISRKDADYFLKECLRVLKPGGVIRIAVPDARKITEYFIDVDFGGIKKVFKDNEGVKNAEDDSEAFWNFLTAGHVTCYDGDDLVSKMKKNGFLTAQFMHVGESFSKNITTETKDMYPDHSVYVEAQKPIKGILSEEELITKVVHGNEKLPTNPIVGGDVVQPLGPLPLPGPSLEELNSQEKKLRIGLLSTQFFGLPPKGYSGLERVIWDLAMGLSKAGHYVRIFAPNGSSVPPNGNVIFTGPALSTVGVDWLRAEASGWNIANKYISDLDIIHGHNWFGLEYMIKNNNMEKPRVCHTHHGGLNAQWWMAQPNQFKMNFIGISQWMQQVYESQGMPSEYVYNGIDMNKYKFRGGKEDFLIFVGRLDSFKRPHIAIEVAKKLGMKLHIFGGSFVGPDSISYMESIKSSCDGKQIIMHMDASQEEKVDFMQRACCLIFPSKMGEPFGLVAAESMACGTPVVASNDGAIGEVVENGKTGYICNLDNPTEDMCNVIKSGIMRMEIRNLDCRDRVEQLFSREKMAEGYIGLYNRILGGNEW